MPAGGRIWFVRRQFDCCPVVILQQTACPRREFLKQNGKLFEIPSFRCPIKTLNFGTHFVVVRSAKRCLLAWEGSLAKRARSSMHESSNLRGIWSAVMADFLFVLATSLSSQRDHARIEPTVAHQLRCAVRYCVGSGKEHGIGRMQIPRSGRTPLMPYQRGDDRLAVTEVCRQAREAVPQHVGRYVRRQSTELGNPLPKFFKAGHDNITAAARCRKHQMTRA